MIARVKQPEPTNEDLALRIQRGDAAAFELLEKRNSGMLYQLAMKAMRGVKGNGVDIEDLLQEARIALHCAAMKWKEDGGAKIITLAWIYVRNATIQAARKDREAIGSLDPRCETPVMVCKRTHRSVDIAIANEQAEIMSWAVGRLPGDFQTVMNTLATGDEDCHSVLGVSRQRVNQRRGRARQMLRALVEAHSDTERPSEMTDDERAYVSVSTHYGKRSQLIAKELSRPVSMVQEAIAARRPGRKRKGL